jgi:hypothetical protein
MTVPKALRLAKHWVDEPPTHILVRALLEGLSGKPLQSKEPQMERKQRPAHAAATPADFKPIQAEELYGTDLFGMPKPIFDLEALEERSRAAARIRARRDHGLPLQ